MFLIISVLAHVLFFIFLFGMFVKDNSPAYEEHANNQNQILSSYLYNPNFANPITKTSTLISENPSGSLQKNIQQKHIQHVASQASSQSQAVVNMKVNQEEIELIGKKKLTDPFILYLGKALRKHLEYPKAAVDFQLKGTTLIGFLIKSNGEISQIKIVKTSGTEILDHAVYTAVNNMGPLNQANQFLKEDKYMVIGVIFD